jgi:hypothetical protein
MTIRVTCEYEGRQISRDLPDSGVVTYPVMDFDGGGTLYVFPGSTILVTNDVVNNNLPLEAFAHANDFALTDDGLLAQYRTCILPEAGASADFTLYRPVIEAVDPIFSGLFVGKDLGMPVEHELKIHLQKI